MDSTKTRDTLLAISNAIIETVREAGPDGAPESIIYLALQQHGATHEQYETFISVLVSLGKLRRSNHTLFIA